MKRWIVDSRISQADVGGGMGAQSGPARTDNRRPGDPALVAALELLRGHTERKGRGWVIDSFSGAWDAFAGHATYRDAVIAG